jgi:signal transduction histidine kinase/ActR/RegA family two-component response regulator
MNDPVNQEIQFLKTCSSLIDLMVDSASIKDFSFSLLKGLIDTTESYIGAFYVLSVDGRDFEYLNSIGMDRVMVEAFHSEILEGEFGRALAMRQITKTDMQTESKRVKLQALFGDVIPGELIMIPVIVNNYCAAIISLVSLHAFSDESLRIINRIWPVMNTVLSNVLSSDENRKLKKELEEKTEIIENKKLVLREQENQLQAQTDVVKSQNEKLKEQTEIVEESNKVKNEFLSNMSHELRTPLNSILSLSRVILLNKKSNLSDDEKNYIDIIKRNGENLLALINDILDLSKIESGRIDLKPRLISLSSVLRVISENLEQTVDRKGITMKLDLPENLPDIESDESRLYQIFQNIIGNAVKFTEEGCVTVSAEYNDIGISVHVADTGIGISEENLPTIFEEFKQLDGTHSRKYEGTGLGLAIAYKSAELIKGKLSVVSREGEGSTFTITLPVSLSGGTVATVKPDTVNKKNDNVRPAPKPDVKNEKHRMLIVEDDLDTVVTLKAVLKEGFIFTEAYDGKEGLKKAGEELPDLILLDITLPQMNGFMVVERLKKDARTRDIPVIAMTALSMDGDKERILKAGCDDYISKPFDIDGMIETIHYWIGKRYEKDTGN